MAITATAGSPITVTGTTNTNDKITDDLVFVKFIYWYAPTTAGHLASIKDKNGKLVGKFKCEVANRSDILPILQLCQGLYCDDLDSGEIYIYIR